MCNLLSFPLSYSDFEADDAVVIPNPEKRNISREIVFALNNLLRRLRYAGAVADREIVCHLLLNRDCRSRSRRGSLSVQALWIDFNVTDSEQASRAGTQRRVQRFSQRRAGSLLAKGSLTGRLQLCRLLLRAAQCQQADDV